MREKKEENRENSGTQGRAFPLEITGRAEIVAMDRDDEFIKSRIFTVRGVQVMFDRDLAALYGVGTGRLNEQVKRNVERFPRTFMLQLTKEELAEWISQNATSNLDKSVMMGLRKLPRVFTEHGIIMLASVLKSEPINKSRCIHGHKILQQ